MDRTPTRAIHGAPEQLRSLQLFLYKTGIVANGSPRVRTRTRHAVEENMDTWTGQFQRRSTQGTISRFHRTQLACMLRTDFTAQQDLPLDRLRTKVIDSGDHNAEDLQRNRR